MTRAERRTRQRTRETAAAGLALHSSRRAPAELTENPNRGKIGAARLDITGEREARTIRDASRDYRPLTVHTPVLRARKNPRTTSYTI